jgi:hypothetical protein
MNEKKSGISRPCWEHKGSLPHPATRVLIWATTTSGEAATEEQ